MCNGLKLNNFFDKNVIILFLFNMILFSDKNCKDEELIVKIKQEKVSKRTKL